MVGWEKIKFGNIADFKNGINFSKDQKGNSGIPTIDVKNMFGNTCYVNLGNLYSVNKNINNDYYLRNGDILFVRSSLKEEGVGWTSLYRGSELSHSFCGFIIRARLNEHNRDKYDPEFLTYFFRSDALRKELISLSGRVAITNVNQGLLKSLIFQIPPLPEQRKIAYILSTVQKAIEQQDKLIKTTTELKKALMQKLFTEGLYGEKQKQTEIGPVPESWEVVELKKYLLKTVLKDPTKNPNDKFVYIDVSSVSNDFFKIAYPKTMLGKDAPSRARKLIQEGDVIFATVRPTLKRIAKVNSDYHNQICSTGYVVLKPNQKFLTQEFLYQYVQTEYFINRIEKLQRGASYPAVRDTDVKGMLIPLPKLNIQQEIGSVLATFDKKMSIIQKKKQTLSDLFKTMLHELMTGQRRVNEIDFENDKEELLMAAEPKMEYNKE